MTGFIWTARAITVPAVAASLLVGVLTTACASSGSLGDHQVSDAVQPSRASSRASLSPISRQEISTVPALNAYDAALKLRPLFFTNGRPASLAHAGIRPSVVIDDGIPEPLDVLQTLQVTGVAEIRFVESFEATMHYGSAFTAGIILVRLR